MHRADGGTVCVGLYATIALDCLCVSPGHGVDSSVRTKRTHAFKNFVQPNICCIFFESIHFHCVCMALTFDAFPLHPIATLPLDAPTRDHFLAPLGLLDVMGGVLNDGICISGFYPGFSNPSVHGFRIGHLQGVGPLLYYHDDSALPCMGGLLPPGVTNLPRNRSNPIFFSYSSLFLVSFVMDAKVVATLLGDIRLESATMQAIQSERT